MRVEALGHESRSLTGRGSLSRALGGVLSLSHADPVAYTRRWRSRTPFS
jgi:hypothetical protein